MSATRFIAALRSAERSKFPKKRDTLPERFFQPDYFIRPVIDGQAIFVRLSRGRELMIGNLDDFTAQAARSKS